MNNNFKRISSHGFILIVFVGVLALFTSYLIQEAVFAVNATGNVEIFNAFSDVDLGGTTSGTVTSSGDQILTIIDEPNPTGFRIKADSSGGTSAAIIDFCNGASRVFLTAGDEVVITCSSVIIEVINGTVEITLVADNGTTGTTALNAGNGLTFEPQTSTITANSNNSDTIVVIIDGTELLVSPGETASFMLEFCGKTIDQFNVINGTEHDDRLRGTQNNDLIRGFGGDDRIIGMKGDDCLIGGVGNDTILGGSGDDMMEGNDGHDTIFGNNDNDSISGGKDNDRIHGNAGNDIIDGGDGLDKCKGNQGNNIITNCE